MSAGKLPAVRARDVVRALESIGYSKWRQTGSHLTMYRESDRRALTVPVHSGKDLPRGTLRTIIRSAGMSVEAFKQLL